MGYGDVPVEFLSACYQAFAQRRVARGARSVRTRLGYARLRNKYQPRLRLLQDGTRLDAETATKKTVDGTEEATEEVGAPHSRDYATYSDGQDEDGGLLRKWPVAKAPQPQPAVESDQVESEATALQQLVGVFFDARIKRLVLETIWPLAHHGGNGGSGRQETAKLQPHVLAAVPEWQELEQHKYFSFMFTTMVWLFPGLPAFEAQEQAENGWKKDCEFDAFGSYGLSFEGFMVSLLDLALTCTGSSVDKCVEFLTHLTKRLEVALPVFRVPTANVLASLTKDDDRNSPASDRNQEILWKSIPLEKICPCTLRPQPQFLALKAKLSTAPLVLMVLAENKRQFELQLSTSAKLLVRECDDRSSIRRKTTQSHALSHFVEIEKQFLWRFRSFPGRPTLIILPSGLVSKRTLSLYASCRLLKSHQLSIGNTLEDKAEIDPLLTLYTTIQDPFPLRFGSENSICGKVNRQSSRLFVIDHRSREPKRFQIVFKISLIHSTSSAGGFGAAAVEAQLPNVVSVETAQCKREFNEGATQPLSQASAHSFIFIVKTTPSIREHGPQRRRPSSSGHGKRTSKANDASVPAQWFTTLCGANENKTIVIDASLDEAVTGVDSDDGVYYVNVFTLHGFYFEAIYEDYTDAEKSTKGPASNLPTLEQPQEPSQHTDNQGSPTSLFCVAEGDNDIIGIPEGYGGVKRAPSPGLKSVSTSAALLRQILQLQKQRQQQATAKPPPDYISGSKITSMKILSSAAGLRAKFLKARAVERRTKFLENEATFQEKVEAKLEKIEAKKRALRGSVTGSALLRATHTTPPSNTLTDASVSADFQANATLMVSFFEEMAAKRPSQREQDQTNSEEAVHVKGEEELFEKSADLSDIDHASQNMLNAENWLPANDKAMRRRSLLEDRIKHRREWLLLLNKQQEPERHEKQYEHKADDREISATPRASDDYYNTAILISQLMKEVAEEEHMRVRSSKTDHLDAEEADYSRELAATCKCATSRGEQATDPQGYQLQHETPSQSNTRDHEAQEIEAVSREDWLSSRYTRNLAMNERLQHHHGELRPTLVPARQHLDDDLYLPWNPVWEVHQFDASGDGNEDSPRKLQRPNTATTEFFSPRPPSSDAKSVLRSAALSRLHTRRIRSAHTGARQRLSGGRSVPSVPVDHYAPKSILDNTGVEAARHTVDYVPLAFMQDNDRPCAEAVGKDDVEVPQLCEQLVECPSVEEKIPCTQANKIDVDETRFAVYVSQKHLQDVRNLTDSTTHNTDTNHMIESTLSKPRARKPKKTKRKSIEEKQFDGRVKELLSISPVIQSFQSY